MGGGRHRLPEGRDILARGGRAVLRHPGQGRQLPDRGQCPCQAADRRARCRISEGEHHRSKWQPALDMLDELAAVGLRPAVLVADTGYGANADFRHGLEDRGLAYALRVKGEMTAHAESAVPLQPLYGGLGPRSLPRYRTHPVSLREHVLAQGRDRAAADDTEADRAGPA
ncbi:transposase [Streptomyces sp. NBC_01511]